MFGLGMGEVILVLIIALVFIGPKKLPELAKSLGKGMREFQNAAKGFQDQVTNEVKDIAPKVDSEDLPQVEEIKTEIVEADTGHGDWDPEADDAAATTNPQKDENKA